MKWSVSNLFGRHSDVDRTCRKVSEVILQHRSKKEKHCNDSTCKSCITHLGDRVRAFVRNGQPIEIVMPSFAAKSSLRSNTLSYHADEAERQAIVRFGALVKSVEHYYQPGVNLIIASDAWLFQPLRKEAGFDVSVEQVAEYLQELRSMALCEAFDKITIFTPADLYPEVNPGVDLLNRLLSEYQRKTPEEVVASKLATGSDEVSHLRHYWERDYATLYAERSIVMFKNRIKQLAYPFAARAMQATSAWSNVVAERYPLAIRASIHPRCLHDTRKLPQDRFALSFAPTPPSRLVAHAKNHQEPRTVSPWRGVWLADLVSGGGMIVRNAFAKAIAANLELDAAGLPSHYSV